MFTDEELEMLQWRIDDPDWDMSQRNDVWELLPRLLEVAKAAQRSVHLTSGILRRHKHNRRLEVIPLDEADTTPPNKACTGQGYAPASQRVLHNNRIRKNGSVA
jgi:hypothetical protein